MTQSLMLRTKQLLRESTKSLSEIHVELRLAGIDDISYYWLRKFASGNVEDPSVNRVQQLYEHLTGLPLTVN